MGKVDLRAPGNADGTGAVTLKFQAPAQVEMWTVTVSVPGSAPTTVWMVNVTGQPVATLQGANAVKDLQLFGAEVVTLVTKNAAPNSQQIGRMIGRSAPINSEDPIPLDAPTMATSNNVPQVLLFQGITLTPAVINMSAPYRTIELMVNPKPGNVPYRVVVIGNESGFTYIDTGSVAVLGAQRWVAHVNVAVDTEIVAALTVGSATPAESWLTAELDTYDVVPDVTGISGLAPLTVTGTGTFTISGTVSVSGTVKVSPALQATPLDEPDVLIASTGTAVQITPSTIPTTGLVIQALQQNTGFGANTLRVGSSSVLISGTPRGLQLAPGQSLSIPIANYNDLWINGQINDGVCLLGL